MKKSYVFALALIAGLFFFNEMMSFTGGPPDSVSGAPMENNCTMCHAGTVNSGLGQGSITSDIPMDGYTPGQTYSITASITQDGASKFGFQVLPSFTVTDSSQAGIPVITDATNTKLVNGASRSYVAHTESGTSMDNWSFDWVAPASGTGDVVFYGALNASNSNDSASGDNIYTVELAISENDVVGFSSINNDSWKVFPTRVSDMVSVVSTKGLSGDYSISITNLEGKLLFSERNLNQDHSLDVNWLTPGIYMVSVQTSNEVYNTKIIKN